MQQLKIVHTKKSANNNNSKQVVSNSSETKKQTQQELVVENKREGHGRSIALTRKVFRLENSDTFYVESESTNNVYYFVRYNFSGIQWCSCPDNSTRGIKCKHQFAIEYSIRLGTLKDIEKLPKEAKRYGATVAQQSKSWKEDEYTF